MNQLSIINKEGKFFVDSRDVAGMVGKNHSDLLRDIRNYSEILGESNFALADFFIFSNYIDSQQKDRPCYLLTKRGCDMVANKMTGEKGVLFTATYVTKFEEMEKQIKGNVMNLEGLSPQMQLIATLTQNAMEVDRKINEVKVDVDRMEQRINTSIATLTEEVKKDWKDTINSRINELCARCGFNYQTFRSDLYSELEQIASCNLGIRQKKLRERMDKAGATYKEKNGITKIHVIEKDGNLKQIFEGIVNKYVLKYSD